MRLAPAVLALLLATRAGVATPAASAPADALRAGDYTAAIAGLRKQAAQEPRSAAAVRALARTLIEVGRYAEAEEVARTFQAASPRSAELQETLGEVLLARGRVADAEAAFKKSIIAGATDALVAEVRLAVLRSDRGEREAASAGFHRLVQAYNDGQARTSEQLTAVGTACRYLGAEDPQHFKDALKAYDE